MRLESARDLKIELLADERISPVSYGATESQELSLFALGIALMKGGEFGVAVRFEEDDAVTAGVAETISERAKYEVDVRFTGPILAQAGCAPGHRPLTVGCSVGHPAVTAGTLGCFLDGGASLFLSNNHVLAAAGAGQIGDPIVHPGAIDGGVIPADRVGTVDRVAHLAIGGVNRIDAATCRLDPGVDARVPRDGEPGYWVGQSVDPLEIAEYEVVEKVGRTTGHTTGRVVAVEVDRVTVRYPTAGWARFDGQVEFEGSDEAAFSRGGDSGSLIYTAGSRSPLGLLFAGSERGGTNGQGLTFANPLADVYAWLAE